MHRDKKSIAHAKIQRSCHPQEFQLQCLIVPELEARPIARAKEPGPGGSGKKSAEKDSICWSMRGIVLGKHTAISCSFSLAPQNLIPLI